MGIINGHQLSTFSTPVNGTTPIDANTVRGNDNTIKTSYNAHDADATIHLQSGVASARPAQGTAGQTWLATDAGGVFLSIDNGAAWVDINYIRTTATSLPANVLASSLTSVGVLAAPHMTAPVVDSGGMAISSGTLAAQAVTATSGTFSGKLISTAVNGGLANIDASAPVTIANNATAPITFGAGYGFIMITDRTHGFMALWAVRNGAGQQVWDDGNTGFSGVQDTAGHVNIYVSGGNLVLQNKTGGSVNVSCATFLLN